MFKPLAIFSGNANPVLANAVCHALEIPLGKSLVSSFSDGETRVEIQQNVRGLDVYVLQPTCAPVNQNLMDLLVMVDALKRASAASITAVIPYFGYARQDRKSKPRTPITAKLVADLLSTAGVDRVVSVDLHAGQIQGFFDMPVDNLYALPVFLEDLRANDLCGEGTVIVSPDAGGVERARVYAKAMGSTLAIIDKRRPAPNQTEIMNLIGDVSGKNAVLIDDLVDTAGTAAQAAAVLAKNGATSIILCATHGVLSGPAIDRLDEAPLDQVIVTDTIPQGSRSGKIRTLSVARLLADAVRCIHNGDSVSRLFM